MSYLKHKVSLPQNLEDLEDGDGASAIYVGDTKVTSLSSGLKQRLKTPGIPHYIDDAVDQFLRAWSNVNDGGDALTVTVDMPTNWSAYEYVVSDDFSGTGVVSTSNIGTLKNVRGHLPWGFGEDNDGFSYFYNTYLLEAQQSPSGNLWNHIRDNAPQTVGPGDVISVVPTKFVICKGGGWYEARTDYQKRFHRRVLYRAMAFGAGLHLDHPQSLWCKVLSDEDLIAMFQAFHDHTDAPLSGKINNYRWEVGDAQLGTISLVSQGVGLSRDAYLKEVVSAIGAGTDSLLSYPVNPRTVYDYVTVGGRDRYTFMYEQVFSNIDGNDGNKLKDGTSYELSPAMRDTHQVAWLTATFPYSRVGTAQIQFEAGGAGGFVEMRWCQVNSPGETDLNYNGGGWEDNFALSTLDALGSAAPWSRPIVNFRSSQPPVVGDDTSDGQGALMQSPPLAIGLILPNNYTGTIKALIEVEIDAQQDVSQFQTVNKRG